jgi:predicted Rossmann-fold nucleotide-binding protein
MPVILFGSSFWKPLDEYIKKIQVDTFGTIEAADRNLYTITDDIEEVIAIAKAAPTKPQMNINE